MYIFVISVSGTEQGRGGLYAHMRVFGTKFQSMCDVTGIKPTARVHGPSRI